MNYNPPINQNTATGYKRAQSINVFDNFEEIDDNYIQESYSTEVESEVDSLDDNIGTAWKEILPKNVLLPKSASFSDVLTNANAVNANAVNANAVNANAVNANAVNANGSLSAGTPHYYKNPPHPPINSSAKQLSQTVHCNNCGKQGHLFHQCKLPITSYGMIVCRSSERGIEFLMIRRKDSFGYIDFMRGKYSPYNLEQLQNSINEMSITEKERILNEGFDTLWKDLWGWSTNSQYRNEEMSSCKKFQLITNGVVISNDEKVTLQDLVNSSTTNWEETEWEFPKGRRTNQEKDLDCALREFQEETGCLSEDITIIENVLPFEEIYVGSNHKSYKHKYFVGYMNKSVDELQSYQKSEVSKVEWKTLEECLEAIRPYNLEKKKIIINVCNMLQEYRIYS